MIRDDLIQGLRQAPTGLPLATLLAQAGLDTQDADLAEAILLLSPEVGHGESRRWRLLDCGRVGRLLAAIDGFAASSGRKLFRAEAALADLPAHEHPTQEELQEAIEASGGRYSLLPNLMIRRNS
jgi:hypothetical protein